MEKIRKTYRKLKGGGDPDPDYFDENGDPIGGYNTTGGAPVGAEGWENSSTEGEGGGGGGVNWGKVGSTISDVVPYISNIASAFRKLPNPPQPVQESYVRANHINLSASRASIGRQLRSMQLGNRMAIGNQGVAAANNAVAFAQAVQGNNEVNQQEANANAREDDIAQQENIGIGARNTERTNGYNRDVVARQIAQSQLKYDNISNASDKFQQQSRDKKLMALEDRKLDLLPELYKDTGVYDRNIMKYSEAERYKKHRKRNS